MSQEFKRWYDYDPLLLKVIGLLKDYQDELKEQAVVFLENIEKKVSKEAIDKFYQLVKPINGSRWYDKDPVISKTIELLRVVPVEVQQRAAKTFIASLEDRGIKVD